MIKSRVLNGLIFFVGLLFAAAGLSYVAEGVRSRHFGHANWLVPGIIAAADLGIAVWCCAGALYNLRHRHDSPPAEPTGPARAVKVLLFLAAFGFASLVGGCALEARGPLGPSVGTRLVRIGLAALLSEVIFVPLVVLWYSISRRRSRVHSSGGATVDHGAA